MIIEHKRTTIKPGFCKCGCGAKTNWSVNKKRYNLFIRSHYFKLHGHSDSAKKKISISRKGKALTEEHKKAISIAGTGKKRTEETKRRISEALKKHEYDPERIKKLKENSFDATGRKWSDEVKKKISESNKGKHKNFGERNSNWKNGVSFFPYPVVWNSQLKKKIKERDGDKCQNPECPKSCLTMTIHHIDYVKENCGEENLITLCISCNSRANSRRDFWAKLYSGIIKEKYGW